MFLSFSKLQLWWFKAFILQMTWKSDSFFEKLVNYFHLWIKASVVSCELRLPTQTASRFFFSVRSAGQFIHLIINHTAYVCGIINDQWQHYEVFINRVTHSVVVRHNHSWSYSHVITTVEKPFGWCSNSYVPLKLCIYDCNIFNFDSPKGLWRPQWHVVKYDKSIVDNVCSFC